jgi:hypothetical protein
MAEDLIAGVAWVQKISVKVCLKIFYQGLIEKLKPGSGNTR